MKAFNNKNSSFILNLKQNKNTYIKRISIVISCVILVVAIIMFTFAYYESNLEFTMVNGRVGESLKDINIVAIYQGENKVDEIPAKDTGWAFQRAECTNGATAEWNYDRWAVLISSTTKTKCTLYFEERQLAVDYINTIAPTTDSLLTDGTTDNNLRYVGANPNNYVSFNNELWRVIGVMNNIETESGETQSLVKIIRDESLGNYSWDSSASSINGGYGVNEWSQADLMQELNNDYLGNVVVGTDGNWYSGQNNAKSTAKPSTTISSEEQNKIESVKWKLGSPNNNNGTYVSYDSEDLKAPYVYTHERGNNTGKICTSGTYCNDTVTRQTTWTGKVGLFYASDYLYATSGGNATNRAACLNTKQYNWNDTSVSDCKNNDWLYDSSNNQSTLSPLADSSYATRVFFVYSGGYVGRSNANYARGVCPVVFLKSSISITGGDGSSTNPYTIG